MNWARFSLDPLLWPSDPHFNVHMGDDEERMCYVGNFTSAVTAELLEELFTQVGPVEKVTLSDRNSYRFAMVTFEDEESVPFAVRTLDGIGLFDTPLRVKPRNDQVKSAIDSVETFRVRFYALHLIVSNWFSFEGIDLTRVFFRESYGERWHSHLPPMPSLAVLSTLTSPPRPPPLSSPLKYDMYCDRRLKHDRLQHILISAALGQDSAEGEETGNGIVAVGESRIVIVKPDTRTVQSIGRPANTGDSECSILVLFKVAYFFWHS
ncbi:unnamed protein product [Angiostrongylus costaricensis]|uniref:RRM domain-containing protein n=1 Tax=Angiostrongylus costaricensis TaxID=334426 RepID=A0A0R3Q1E6_ANGCS|nr:unnamed protein product [Angiostrongylus costaricensis]